MLAKSILLLKFAAHFHQENSRAIPTTAIRSRAPVRVTSVLFNEMKTRCFYQTCFELWILCKFCPESSEHDILFDLFPVCAEML